MSVDQTELEALFSRHGYSAFKWIDPKQIVVAQWVRMKCEFGCPDYGKKPGCPPNNPSVSECREFFGEYSRAVVFHFQQQLAESKERHVWLRQVNLGLSKLERDVFLAGYRKAFVLFMDSCSLCDECAERREDCKKPAIMRPSPEAMGVDVFATVKPYGLPIQVLKDYTQPMNRYALLLVE